VGFHAAERCRLVLPIHPRVWHPARLGGLRIGTVLRDEDDRGLGHVFGMYQRLEHFRQVLWTTVDRNKNGNLVATLERPHTIRVRGSCVSQSTSTGSGQPELAEEIKGPDDGEQGKESENRSHLLVFFLRARRCCEKGTAARAAPSWLSRSVPR
jgi:hypothetical protein